MSFQRRITSKDRPYRFNPVTKRPLCRWCGKDVPPPKRTFCGEDCVHQYLLRSDPRYLRTKVFERDKGICAQCGFDSVKFERELWKLPSSDREAYKIAAGMPLHRDTFWDADHVLPVCEGGGLCDLSNMRTLCVLCHKARAQKTLEPVEVALEPRRNPEEGALVGPIGDGTPGLTHVG